MMSHTRGEVTAVNGNMVSVRFEGDVSMNEVAYILSQGKKLKCRSEERRVGKE